MTEVDVALCCIIILHHLLLKKKNINQSGLFCNHLYYG